MLAGDGARDEDDEEPTPTGGERADIDSGDIDDGGDLAELSTGTHKRGPVRMALGDRTTRQARPCEDGMGDRTTRQERPCEDSMGGPDHTASETSEALHTNNVHSKAAIANGSINGCDQTNFREKERTYRWVTALHINRRKNVP